MDSSEKGTPIPCVQESGVTCVHSEISRLNRLHRLNQRLKARGLKHLNDFLRLLRKIQKQGASFFASNLQGNDMTRMAPLDSKA
jgi:hypothetical protein